MIPLALRTELLCFAERQTIDRGQLFRTPNGLLNRRAVWEKIQHLCLAAGISERKVSAQAFTMLYQETYSTIQKEFEPIVRQNYDQLLEEEQDEIGWSVPGGSQMRKQTTSLTKKEMAVK